VLLVSDQWGAHRPHQALAVALFLHVRQGFFENICEILSNKKHVQFSGD
jgi:hypothetical protein